MLSLKQVDHVCRGDGSGKNFCRFLEQDDFEATKFYCLKLVPGKRESIDQDVDEYVRKTIQKGIAPSDDMPLGDNCSGYIKLKSVLQGYDVK